jgi:cold shock protein
MRGSRTSSGCVRSVAVTSGPHILRRIEKSQRQPRLRHRRPVRPRTRPRRLPETCRRTRRRLQPRQIRPRRRSPIRIDFQLAYCLDWRTFRATRAGRRTEGFAGMPTGTIARLLIDKGFGFIRDEGGIEHFFHRSSVRGAVFELLREGQRVEFTPEDSQKGPRAGDVRLVEG